MKEAEIVSTGICFVDLEILMDRWKDVQSRDWETIGSIVIASDNKVKIINKLRGVNLLSPAFRIDLNTEWIECTRCHTCVQNI